MSKSHFAPGDSPGANLHRRDLLARTIQLRAETLNEENRSVEAVIVTDRIAQVWDFKRWEVIDELLRIDGAILPDQVPLLESHQRWSLDNVLGSGRQLRKEPGQVLGRLFLADEDRTADRAWNKIRQGHLTDVSAGYRSVEYTDLMPGETRQINGKTYTAGERILRVTTRWELKEVSLVPIGADPASKIREEETPIQGRRPRSPVFEEETLPMNPMLRKYLESIGLRAEATDKEAEEFWRQLEGQRRELADALATRSDPPAAQPAAGQRSDPPAEPAKKKHDDGQRADPPANPSADPAALREEGARAERQRQTRIRQLQIRGVSDELVQRAIDEGWDEARAAGEFLSALRGSASEPIRPDGPAIHSRSREQDTTVRSLAAAMMIGHGMDPTKHRLHNGRQLPTSRDQLTEQDCDRASRFLGMSALDLVRECICLETGQRWLNPQELFMQARSSVSGGTLSYVFGTNVYARLIEGYQTVGDTTLGWCTEVDLPNFLQQEEIAVTTNARLKRLPSGATADHATFSDTHETWKIHRHAIQLVWDDQDIISDRLGGHLEIVGEFGEAARRIRPDLVYSMMNENPNLVADSTAVFASGHSNLGTGALSAANLKIGITAVAAQRDANSNVLNLRPRFILVPAALDWTARELANSTMLAKLFADSSDPFYSQLNLLAEEGLRVVIDDRLGATGVIDPRTGTARTGSATAWYLAVGGSRSIRVGYLRGTGRAPQMRSFVLDRGQWGLGWDINMDVGAAFMDYRPWYKSTGAA